MNNPHPYIQLLKPLIGGKITKIIVDPTMYGDTYMGFIVEKGKKIYEVVGQADAEGNGAGFISVTDVTSHIPPQQKPIDNAPVV